jgi:YaaC-like Protein
MSRLPQPLTGQVLAAKGRALPFSFFPVTRNTRRFGLYDAVFAVNPWSVVRGAVSIELPVASQPEALAFLRQAEDFYRAASAGLSTNPLLLYYAFLNLGKALIRVRGYAGSLDQAMHGLKENTAPGGTELEDSNVIAKDGGSATNVYPELIQRLGYGRPRNNDSYPVAELLPQVVVGHRIWRETATAHRERFIDLKHIQFIDNREERRLWLRMFLSRGDLSRYSVTRSRLLAEGHLAGMFREVDATPIAPSDDLVCLEQQTPLSYTGRPTDVVADLVASVRPQLWRIISAIPGAAYRRYYLHMTPPGQLRLPQLASLWALFYYLGSVVRYRPHLFDELLRSPNGAFISEFISAQADQMLYLLASEFCQREIARPAIA